MYKYKLLLMTWIILSSVISYTKRDSRYMKGIFKVKVRNEQLKDYVTYSMNSA